ncbi:hypothetical protein Rhal01_00795 [Rubritalea halochordaticola]|uniref:Cytochrome c domain-containing protein n=1 Tax=Rubritalea halochordaticola TaxID=714537 RepID=A0ABP9V1X7_9BACT
MSSEPTPVDPKKPDLEESTNVREAHADVLRTATAAAREQHLRENGLEPVSVWIMIAGFIVALVGGSVLLSSGEFFSYDSLVREGYVQAVNESGPEVDPTAPVVDAYMKKGGSIYATRCASCHTPGGTGDGANFPPLAGSEWVNTSGAVPSLVILHGLAGQIEVAGKTYNGNMPPMGDGLTDFELAALLYFIQNSWGNEVGKIYGPEQIAEIRKIADSVTGGQTTAEELKKHLDQELPGEYLTEDKQINLKTGEVVDAAQ